MDRERFLEWVAGSRWRVAKSSPHSYTIRFWHGDRRAFEEAVRFVHENGEPGRWGKQEFVYFRIGGYRYWSYWQGQFPIVETVCFNRAAEPQLRLW